MLSWAGSLTVHHRSLHRFTLFSQIPSKRHTVNNECKRHLLQPLHIVDIWDGQADTVGQDGYQDNEVKHLVRDQIHCYSPQWVPSWQNETGWGGREAWDGCGVKPSGQHYESLDKKQNIFHNYLHNHILLSGPGKALQLSQIERL